MKKIIFLLVILLNVKDVFPQMADYSAIHRIGDYGKLWCVLRLFHPAMAYNDIDADSLFTENITDLFKDPSRINFRNAIRKMIDRLHDPYTMIEENVKNSSDTTDIPKRSLMRWLNDSIVLLHFDADFVAENSGRFSPALSKLIDSLRNARGIIIDLRKTTRNNDEYANFYESAFMKNLISYLTDHNLGLPSYRSRIHYGHESETFDMSSFYYQGWFLQNSTVIYRNPRAVHTPVCLLINRFDNTISDAIAAMQEGHIAKVVAEDSLGNFEPSTSYPMKLTDSITVNIRMTEVLYSSGNKTFSPDALISYTNAGTNDTLIHTAVHLLKTGKEFKKVLGVQSQNLFVSKKVRDYDSLVYPTAPLRLLGLMRYWSAINYFCPNKDLITKNWDSVLYEYVPKFLNAKDSFDYMLTVARLITEIHDGHGWFGSRQMQALTPKTPPLQLRYVETKTIVYKVLNDSLKKKISPGDELIAVNDRPVKMCRDSIAQFVGASNNASLQREVTINLLAGRENTVVKINFLRNNKPTVISLPRDEDKWKVAFPAPEGPVWKKINDKIGYVDFGRLQVSQIDSMFKGLNNTDAIILDDRSYPQGTVWTLVNYLTDKTVISAKGTTMVADSPDPLTVTRQDQLWTIPVTPQPLRYKGRIIILVNEETQSQAEYSCMVLQAAYKKVTIIGSQTAGADGDVTGISIPGGIQTAFSGHGVHYPDGRPTQGVGIVPDVRISPTVRGIKEGRDEVLERAIVFAKSGK
jgi:C-terminal processing protease CtpA/Prc